MTELRAEWADGRRQISTVVTAEVLQSYKGEPSRTVSFRVPGGQIGRYRSVMVGAPVFRPGDEAVLFLQPGSDAVRQVFGLNQGVFRVRQDARTGRKVVITPIVTASIDRAQRVVRGAANRRPVPLPVFGAQVQAAMAAQRGGAR